jgi:hypothetical protein
MAIKIPKGRKTDKMAQKYNYIFNWKTLQNLPKLGFLLENIPSGKPGYVRKND